ncbi:hypothetical protein JXJ21_09005 [candidate division KSB1 bacterium]|nr:hypothetical protein [candidate division KSB1 bacterium]
MKAIFIILLGFAINSSLHADMVVTRKGSYQGRILSANKKSVKFATSKKIIAIEKSLILSYTFTTSDMLYFTNGKRAKCKILGILKGYVLYATRRKAFKRKEASITKIQRGIRSELQIYSIPFTTYGFIPTSYKILNSQKPSNSFIYLKLPSIGLLNASLNDWKDRFASKTGKHPDTYGYPISGGIGIKLNRYMNIGLGYEYFFRPPIRLIDNPVTDKGEDTLSYLFPHASIKFCLIRKSYLGIYLNGELGLIQAKEELKNPQSISEYFTGENFAARMKIGFSFPLLNKIDGYIETGYQSAKVMDINSRDEHVANYSLDFSGIILSCGLGYHINF